MGDFLRFPYPVRLFPAPLDIPSPHPSTLRFWSILEMPFDRRLRRGQGSSSRGVHQSTGDAGSDLFFAMFQLVYASMATREFSDSELFEMLTKFREKNFRWEITGLLLFKQGAFMQVLEGNEHIVRDLYDVICEDEKHHHVNTLLKITVGRRQFPDWSMGFQHLGTADVTAVAGYRAPRELPPWVDILPWKASVAMKFLATFNKRE